MRNHKLSSRFAKALYDFASDTKNIETVYQDILLVKQVLTDNQELKIALESPIIPEDKKQKIFNKVFTKNLCDSTFKFFTLIIKKRREPQLLMICVHFIKLYYVSHNIKEAYITTAEPLSVEMKQYLKNYIEKDSPYTFILHFTVNQDLIGGIIVKVDDLYFDASIKTKINKLKVEFSKNSYTTGF